MKATFAAGCFWGVQNHFDCIPGVKSTEVGYTGGHHDDPTYEEVCTGLTGHAESIQIEYDEKETKYEDLLKIFFSIHDPTQRNRQGPDIGHQYRSAIFYHDEKQKKGAMNVMSRIQGKHDKEIVTELAEAGKFYKAEEYHQKYLVKRGKAVCNSK